MSNFGVIIDKAKMESTEIQKSELDFLQSLNVTQTKASEIMNKYGLKDKEMAVACAMSTVFTNNN